MGGWSWVDELEVVGLGAVGLVMAAKDNLGSLADWSKALDYVSIHFNQEGTMTKTFSAGNWNFQQGSFVFV